MSKKGLPEQKNGYENILISIEVLSRYAFTEPLKTKSGKDTARAMELILSKFKVRFGDYSKVVQFDEGKEFNNKVVDRLLEEKGIRSFSTLIKKSMRRDSEDEDEKRYNKSNILLNRKAALVER